MTNEKKSVSVCCAVGVFFGTADCDLNWFLSEWTAGMWFFSKHASRTFSILCHLMYFINLWCCNRLGQGSNSWPGPKHVCHCIYKCALCGLSLISLHHKSFTCISCVEKYFRSAQSGLLVPKCWSLVRCVSVFAGLWGREVRRRSFSFGHELLGQIFSRGTHQKV